MSQHYLDESDADDGPLPSGAKGFLMNHCERCGSTVKYLPPISDGMCVSCHEALRLDHDRAQTERRTDARPSARATDSTGPLDFAAVNCEADAVADALGRYLWDCYKRMDAALKAAGV